MPPAMNNKQMRSSGDSAGAGGAWCSQGDSSGDSEAGAVLGSGICTQTSLAAPPAPPATLGLVPRAVTDHMGSPAKGAQRPSVSHQGTVPGAQTDRRK